MLKSTSVILLLAVTMDTLHHVIPQGIVLQGIEDCQPISKDCKPDCVTYDKSCPICKCSAGGPSSSPFNQGNNLYETPYSTSLMGMGSARPMMVMSAGTGSMMGNSGGRLGPLPWSLFHRGSPVMMTYACIKADIVCPAYCLEEDENGCKSCPCGPANGMGIPIVTSHVRPEKPKPATDCIATIICMLSCKGYKLGPKGNDGCQTCTCIRNDSKEAEAMSGKNSTSSKDLPNPFQMSSMTSGSTSSSFGSGFGMGSGSGTATSNGNSGKSKNESNSESSPFHVDKMPGGSSVGYGSNSGSGFASASGAGMPSPFSTGSGSGSSGSGGDFNPLFPGASMTMDGSGSGGGMANGGGGDGSGSGCSGPFCTSSSSQNSGILGNAAGGTGSGSSCTGPSCSKDGFNPMFPGAGMTMDGKGNGGGMTSGGSGSGSGCSGPFCTASPSQNSGSNPAKGSRCPNTDLCVSTCKHTVKLGPAGQDGCHSCACVMKEETRPQQKLCDKVVQCITSCQSGYEVGNSKDQDGCPSCVCHQGPTSAPTKAPDHDSCDVTTLACIANCKFGYIIESKNAVTSECPLCKCLPPPTTPAPKPNVYSVLQNCPQAVHCMTSCSHGYSMATSPGEACPRCTCNQVSVSNVQCVTPLSCPRGCSVGYKCGTDGCPVCDCINPTDVGVALTTAYLTASLVCDAHFTCINRCPFGYKSGYNGCPSCQCLLPVPAKVPIVTGSAANLIAGSGPGSHQAGVSLVPNLVAVAPASVQHIPQPPASSSLSTSSVSPSSSSSAISGTGNGGHASVVVPPHLPLSGPSLTVTGSHAMGSPLGSVAGNTDCVGPACSAPNGLHVHGKQHAKKLSPNQCANIVTCVMTCTYGYKLGDKAENGCPECTCLQ